MSTKFLIHLFAELYYNVSNKLCLFSVIDIKVVWTIFGFRQTVLQENTGRFNLLSWADPLIYFLNLWLVGDGHVIQI